MAGLQAQYAPSMYIGLWSRVAGFARDQLTRALEQRAVVQGTLMRATIHLVSARDYWPFALGVRESRRKMWLRLVRSSDPAGFERAADLLRERLAGGPLRRAEVDAVAGEHGVNGVGLWVDLVRAPPAGTWERRRADLFALAEDWLPPPPDLTVEVAREHLVRRYLGGFGPATIAEIGDWAGVSIGDVAPVLDRLAVRRFRDEESRELVDLPRAPLPHPDVPAPVRFLPTWDAALLVHARRAKILPEEYRPRIFNVKMPQSVGTFLVDGAVAGTWKYAGGRVHVEPFRPLDRSTRVEVDEEAERLALLHG